MPKVDQGDRFDLRERGACVARDVTFSQADFDRFARLSGDHNPIHVDSDFAARTRFGATVSHGMLLFSAVRGLVEACFANARLETQDLQFPAPAFADEPLRVVLENLGCSPDGVVELATTVLKADGSPCLQGICRVAPEVAS